MVRWEMETGTADIIPFSATAQKVGMPVAVLKPTA
jgi:hypothetical protein